MMIWSLNILLYSQLHVQPTGLLVNSNNEFISKGDIKVSAYLTIVGILAVEIETLLKCKSSTFLACYSFIMSNDLEFRSAQNSF